MMIDHGFCFNAGEWDFPDAPLRGLYPRHRVYENVAGMDAFEPWLERLEKRITESILGEEPSAFRPSGIRTTGTRSRVSWINSTPAANACAN